MGMDRVLDGERVQPEHLGQLLELTGVRLVQPDPDEAGVVRLAGAGAVSYELYGVGDGLGGGAPAVDERRPVDDGGTPAIVVAPARTTGPGERPEQGLGARRPGGTRRACDFDGGHWGLLPRPQASRGALRPCTRGAREARGRTPSRGEPNS